METTIGPFTELKVSIERKNGEFFDGICFQREQEPLLNSDFVRLMSFDGERFNVTYVRKDDIAVINFSENQKDIYLKCEHIWLTLGGA